MGITLDKEKGMNPRLGMCPQCGKDNGEILLLGNRGYKDVCPHCRMVHYGGAKNKVCQRCGTRTERVQLTDGEKIPGALCPKCREQRDELKKIVEAGGIFWRCRDCGQNGVIRKSDYADAVREKLKIPAPKPCGVEFSKSDCPACNKK